MDTHLWKQTFAQTAEFYTQHTQNTLYAKAGRGRPLPQKLLPNKVMKERIMKDYQVFHKSFHLFFSNNMHKRDSAVISIWLTAADLNIPVYTPYNL